MSKHLRRKPKSKYLTIGSTVYYSHNSSNERKFRTFKINRIYYNYGYLRVDVKENNILYTGLAPEMFSIKDKDNYRFIRETDFNLKLLNEQK